MEFPYTPEQLEAIRRESEERTMKEPHLEGAHFDSESGCLVFEWRGGATAIVPSYTLQALNGATNDQLSKVEIIDDGRGIEWLMLDVQMTTTALLQIVFGIRSIQAVTRQAGSTRTEAKASAARANGAKGGRPRKQLLAT